MRTVNVPEHEKKQSEILDAARRCFVRDGIHNASIASICAEAGVSAGNLYHYFKSKNAIISAIFEMREMRLKYAQKYFSDVESGADLTRKLYDGVDLQFSAGWQDGVSLMFDLIAEAGRSPEIAVLLQSHHQSLRVIMIDTIRDAQKRGYVDKSYEPELAASLIISFFDGIPTLFIRDPQLDTKKVKVLAKTMIGRFLAPLSAKPK